MFKRILQLLEATAEITITVPLMDAIEVSKSGIHEISAQPKLEITIDLADGPSVEGELGFFLTLKLYAVPLSHFRLALHSYP